MRKILPLPLVSAALIFVISSQQMFPNCRQLVANGILDVLKNAQSHDDRNIVLDALAKLSQDEGSEAPHIH